MVHDEQPCPGKVLVGRVKLLLTIWTRLNIEFLLFERGVGTATGTTS